MAVYSRSKEFRLDSVEPVFLHSILYFDIDSDEWKEFRVRCYFLKDGIPHNLYRVDNSFQNRYHADLLYKRPPLRHQSIPVASEPLPAIYSWSKQHIFQNWRGWLSAVQNRAREGNDYI